MKFPAPSFVSVSRRASAWLGAVVILLAAFAAFGAGDFTADFESANKLYEQGRFADAAKAYEKILTAGKTSASVYFNLGNALFRDGQIGRAVYYYRQAERIGPRDADVQANLQFARRTVTGATEIEVDRWQQFLRALTLNEWTTLALVPLWGWLVLLALGQWRAPLKLKCRHYTAAFGFFGWTMAVLLGCVLHDRFRAESAVVVAREAVVRYGPLAESKSYFTLRDGSEVTVSDRKDGWLQVTDSTQRLGWLRKEQVVFLNFPPPLSTSKTARN